MKNYSPNEVSDKLARKENVVLLDVRTPGERASQLIEPSIHIPLQELDTRLTELDSVKGREIICYCAGGVRSVAAAAKLNEKGFDAANMLGGIAAWNLQRK